MEGHKHNKEHEHDTEHKHHEEHRHNKSNTKMWIMAIALGLIIIISAVQAVQLVSLNDKLNEDLADVMAAGSAKKTVSTGSESLKKNLENLPSMVGGC